MRRWGSDRALVWGCAPLLVTLVVGHAPLPDPPYPVAPAPIAQPADASPRPVEDRQPRVLIVGDSIADQHGSHAAVPLREAGFEVRLVTQWGGGLLTRGQYDMGMSRSDPPAGTLMADATSAVAEFDPDIVAVYSNHNYWPPHPRDASGNPIVKGSQAFTAMVRAQLRALYARLIGNGARVYLVEPFPFEGLAPAQNPIWTSYLGLQAELGFGVIRSAQVLTTPEGQVLAELADCTGLPVSPRAPDQQHLSYFGAGLMGTVTAQALVTELSIEAPSGAITAPTEPPVALLPDGVGYRVVTCDGATFGFTALGPRQLGVAAADRAPGDPVVAATTTGLGREGWAVTGGGVVLPLARVGSFGNARLAPGDTVVGIASASRAEGYWIATSSGAVQSFGLAQPLGDLAGQGEAVVAMASTPDRRGYWLLGASGRVEAFGSAAHLGDLRDAVPDDPLVGMAPHPGGEGYWLLDAAGRVYAFGTARHLGSAAGQDLLRLLAWRGFGDYEQEQVPASEAPTRAVGLLPTLSGEGYWIALANGAVCHFGDALPGGGLHLADVQVLQPLVRTPFYGPGACSARVSGDPFSSDGDATASPAIALFG